MWKASSWKLFGVILAVAIGWALSSGMDGRSAGGSVGDASTVGVTLAPTTTSLQGDSKPYDIIFKRAGVPHLSKRVTHLICPPLRYARGQGNKAHWAWRRNAPDLEGSLTGSIDDDGKYTPPDYLEFDDDFSSVKAHAWIGETTQRAYNLPFTADTGPVVTGGYTAIVSGGTVAGASTPGRDIVNVYPKERIRQTGIITQAKFHWDAADADGYAGFTIKIWRKNGTTYDLVAESENLTSQLTGGPGTVTVSFAGISVQRGDCVGVHLIGNNNNMKGSSVGVAACYYTNGDATGTGVDVESWTALATSVLPIHVLDAAPPIIVGIGDSLMARKDSYIGYATGPTGTNSPIANLESLDSRFTFQNMGVGSETTTDVSSRFTEDCIALKPRYALILAGTNDHAASINQATYIGNITDMCDECVTAGILPVVMSIPPCSAGSTAKMQARDAWTAALRTELNTNYPTAIFVDVDHAIGEFRGGGDAGNLWDIQAAYDSGDGVHFTDAGISAIAEVIYNQIFAYVKPNTDNQMLVLFKVELTDKQISALERASITSYIRGL